MVGVLIVVSVDPDGPGSTTGIYFGDIIVNFAGSFIGGVRDLQPYPEPESVGKSLRVVDAEANQIISEQFADKRAAQHSVREAGQNHRC
jgi:hypothetical protein